MTKTIHRPIALRAFTELAEQEKKTRKRGTSTQWPRRVLILDTETTTDHVQRLLFGSYQLGEWVAGELQIVETGLFHADQLAHIDPQGLKTLRRFGDGEGLRLQSRRTFMDEVFYPAVVQAKAVVVGFNLPFDLSRLAISVGEARKHYYGGFSFQLWGWENSGDESPKEHRYRPRLRIRSLDSKRAFIGLSTAKDHKYHPGHFLDLRTLTFALTNQGHSLDSACKAFGISRSKNPVEEHGRITESYIRYNLKDVELTAELLRAVRRKFDQHPLKLRPSKSYSPASVAKAYLRSMGLTPPRQKFTSVPKDRLGDAMAAYVGGRAEARIRRVPVPVVYVDFLSMYPTVNSLLGLWEYLIPEELEVVDVTEEVQELLQSLELDDCFEPDQWPRFSFFAEVEADGDILPVRTHYDLSNPNRNIGVNVLHSDEGVVFAGPDLIASKLLSGKTPKILRAWKLMPRGTQEGLSPIHLGGSVRVDPSDQDFFKAVIEERKSLGERGLKAEDESRLDLFLKVLANSGSYGIFAEFNRQNLPDDRPETVRVFSQDGSFLHESTKPELPGHYSYPPFAALTTSAARLMLAMAERAVDDLGGSYAFCDTDSMAIVATRDGGVVPCPGGAAVSSGRDVVRALSWEQVEQLRARFGQLSPYDETKLGDHSLLEIEDENLGAEREQRQLWVFVISAKRYVMFEKTADDIRIVKHSEHGLGHLMNPTNPDGGSSDWTAEAWRYLLAEELGVGNYEPDWLDRPAISRTTTSSPHVLRPFQGSGCGDSYQESVKPFNFVLSAHVTPMGHPVGLDPTSFHLIAPYTPDPSQWLDQPWTDIHSGRGVPVTTKHPAPPDHAQLRNYRDVLEEYATHPEPKSADSTGKTCSRQTVGLLYRQRIQAVGVQFIGKESNELEAVEKGLVHDVDEVQAEYQTAQPSSWEQDVVPILKKIPARVLADKTGYSERWIKKVRNGHGEPCSDLKGILRDLALRCREGNLGSQFQLPRL